MDKTVYSVAILAANLFMFDTVDAGGVNRAANGGVYNASHNTPDTTGNALNKRQEIFYSKLVLENAQANLVHNQFGDQVTIPERNGKTFSARALDPYPLATEPLEEGVTPQGNKMNQREVLCVCNQYGAYTPHTDMLGLIHTDNIALQDSEELGSQAGRTIDALTRDVINGGTMVQYAPNIVDGKEVKVTSRANITPSARFSTKETFKAARFLKRNNAPTFDGFYVGIVHPDVEMDILTDPLFKETVAYTDNVRRLFEGEIGAIGSVRYVRSSEAMIFEGEGADGTDVYSTLHLGKHAYATANIAGGNLQHIVKPLGSGGTSDPLNQRATRGWKVTHGACRTSEAFMIRVESSSSYVEESED